MIRLIMEMISIIFLRPWRETVIPLQADSMEAKPLVSLEFGA